MKKIMFSSHFGLTEDVIARLKTHTRRIAPDNTPVGFWGETEAKARYKVGEIVAIAQSYKDAGVRFIPGEYDEFGCYDFPAEQTNGWNNKMFVRADLMPHQIRINDIRLERLQEISDEDCIKEGVVKVVHKCPSEVPQYITHYYPCRFFKECADSLGWGRMYDTPQKAFAVLIDMVSGEGTWESNPFVFVYEFKLIK